MFTLQGFSSTTKKWFYLEFRRKQDAVRYAEENCTQWFIGRKA